MEIRPSRAFLSYALGRTFLAALETSGGKRRLDPVTTAALFFVMGAFALHAREYWPFLSDDALISLRYAKRLAAGQGLTWTGTERVEGYTDLLWVLLVALCKKLGGDPVNSARSLDFVGALSAIILVAIDPKPLRLVFSRVISGGLMLASLAPLAIWAIGGLEHGFMAGVIVGALFFLSRALEPDGLRRDRYIAGVFLGALALLRADAVVLVAAAGLGALLVLGRPRRASLKILAEIFGVPIALVALQHLFRFLYYGELVPNTALAKVSFNQVRLKIGWEHVKNGYLPLWPLGVLVLAVLLAGIGRLRKERWVPALCMTLVWSVYLASVGGDIFPGWRQLLLGQVPIAVLLAEGTQSAASRWRFGSLVAAAAILPVLFFTWKRQRVDRENQRGITERWEFDGYPVGRALRGAFAARQPLLAVDAAGALPYWSELPCVDMLGLNDKYIAKHPPKNFGHGGIGHELGDGKYVWDRRPDLIAFNNAGGARDPVFLSGRQLIAMPEFRQTYQLVRVQGDRGNRATGELWFNREGGKLGVTRGEQRIEVPGYFFAGGDAVASPDGAGQLVTSARADAPAKLPSFTLPAGKWQLLVEPPSPEVLIGFRCDGISASNVAAVVPPAIEVDGTRPVDVVVGTLGNGVVAIRSAAFVQTQAASHRCALASDGWLETTSSELSPIQSENRPWAGPTGVVFRLPGVRIRLPVLSHAAAVHLSVDNNDVYELDLIKGQESVGVLRVSPRRNGGGLAVHRLQVSADAKALGFDRIDVRPVDGDGSYSLGHLILIEQ